MRGLANRVAMLGGKALPYDFIESVHLNGSANCYIDTGFKANTTTTRFVGSLWFDNYSANRGVIGSRNVSTATYESCNLFVMNTTSSIRLDWTYGRYFAIMSKPANTKIVIDVSRPLSIVDGIEYLSDITESVDQAGNFLIGSFVSSDTGLVFAPMVGRVGECWLYSNGAVVRHYKPAIRKSDNVVGFWEELSDTFVTNSGFST